MATSDHENATVTHETRFDRPKLSCGADTAEWMEKCNDALAISGPERF